MHSSGRNHRQIITIFSLFLASLLLYGTLWRTFLKLQNSFFIDMQSPSARLSALRTQNGKHKKTCNTRETVVQQVQRQAGRILSAGLSTLDSPYAPLSGRITLTAEFHFTGIRDGAYEKGRRCECRGWEIVLSAVFQCSGYYFLFPRLVFHTIKIPPQTRDSKRTNKHALFALQTHHAHTAAAEAALTLELGSTNHSGSSRGECQSDRLSTKLIHTFCFCCTGVFRDYPSATQVTYANLWRAFLFPSVSWFTCSKFSMATVLKPFQGNYFVELQTL